jgi:hypothetical protein
MNRNIWRRTVFTSISGEVEVAQVDWTLLNPAGEPLARLYKVSGGPMVLDSCWTAEWETAELDLQRAGAQRLKLARRAYRK